MNFQYKIALVVILWAGAGNTALAQNAEKPFEVNAQKIAQGLKDSLGLSQEQYQQIRKINLDLHNEKTAVRKQYSNMDSLQKAMQAVENTRDKRYKEVLSSQQYELYKRKKLVFLTL